LTSLFLSILFALKIFLSFLLVYIKEIKKLSID